ncbi:MAG TPA: FtsX-like permease family protein [Blastocatellia bacterium]|nr:FtsX-like permease family protein [Blastocatellia bacterium]
MKYGKLIFKNILRNKRRTLLTVSSLAVSLFLIITLATVLTELHRGSASANPLRLVSRHAVSLTFDFPYAYRDKVAAVPGVKLATPYCWYGGVYIDEKNFFAQFAVDDKTLREYQPELVMSDAQWDAFVKNRQGAIVGAKLAKLYNFTEGQRITLKSPIYNTEVELYITGIYTGSDEKTLFFHYDYFNELNPSYAKDRVGTLGIVAKTVDDVPKIAQAVDAMFVNTDAPTKTETEREFAISFETMLGGVKQFMYGIIGAITFSLLLVMGSSMAMTVRERTREVGTLKALGFQRGTIAMLFVGEALVLALIGAFVGIGGAALAFNMVDLSLYIPNFMSFRPDTQTLVAAFVGAVLVGVFSVAYSAFRVSNMTIAEALRRVE